LERSAERHSGPELSFPDSGANIRVTG
jgi:hypothetical protein